MDNKALCIVWAILLGLLIFPGSIWFMINPESARNFSKKYGGSGRDRRFHKTPDFAVRLAGIFFFAFGIFIEIGFLAAMGFIQ